MLLVTGGTGFIGSRLIERLIQSRQKIRMLLRPKPTTPVLPKGIALNVAVNSFQDERGLRSALRGVETVIHLATAENQRREVNFEEVDIDGTERLVFAARSAKVEKIIFLSRIGADKNSSFSIMRAKATAEELIRQSGIPFTIIRLSDVFGKDDHFSEEIAKAIRHAPGFLPFPAGEKIMLQPLWIEDLISTLQLILEDHSFSGEVIEIGGGEFLPFFQIIRIISEKINKKRIFFPLSTAYLRIINLWFKQYKSAFPLSTRWLDLLAINRTCPLDSLPKKFQILPARFINHLDYL